MPNAVDAIVLCGGAGTRLKSVTGDAPKSLATIGGRPFLEILMSQLRRHGFQRVILAVGYQRDLIRAHFGDGAHGQTFRYSIESSPLGTGGALRKAIDQVESKTVLIMNGDSYTDGDLTAFAADHQQSKAGMSVLVVPSDGRVDCGLVSVDDESNVLGFKEKKTARGKQYVNAGIYMADTRMFSDVLPGVQLSLETDLFPQWLAEGKHLRAFVHPGQCIDIGTPERYKSARITLASVEPGETSPKPESQRA
jgi:NDP-sugar pyrophosphorylase family protein